MPIDINIGEYVHRLWLLVLVSLLVYIVGRVRHNPVDNKYWTECLTVIVAFILAFIVIAYHIPAFCGADVDLDPNDCIRDSLDSDWFILELIPTLMASWLIVYDVWCSTERATYGSNHTQEPVSFQQQQTSICVFVCFFVHTAFMGVSWVWAEGNDDSRSIVYGIGMAFQFGCLLVAWLAVLLSRQNRLAAIHACRRCCSLTDDPNSPVTVLLRRGALQSDSDRETSLSTATAVIVPDPALIPTTTTTKKKQKRHRARTNPLMVDSRDVRMANVQYEATDAKEDELEMIEVPLAVPASAVDTSTVVNVPRHAIINLDTEASMHPSHTRDAVIGTMIPKPMPSLSPVLMAGVCVMVAIVLNILERISLIQDDPIHYSPVMTYTMHYVQHELVLVALLLCANFSIEKGADVVKVSANGVVTAAAAAATTEEKP